MINKLCTILLAIALPVFLIITATESAVFDRDFFMREMEKNQVTETTGILNSEYSRVTDDIFDYLLGIREDCNIHAEVADDRYVPLFSADEQTHMADVKNIIWTAIYTQIGAAVLFIITGIVLLKRNRRALLWGILTGSVIGLLFLGTVAGLCRVNFTDTFVRLHELVFTNTLWYLDPAESLLINIVPEPYFVDLAIRIGITAAVMNGILTVLSLVLLIRTRSGKTMRRAGRRSNRKF